MAKRGRRSHAAAQPMDKDIKASYASVEKHTPVSASDERRDYMRAAIEQARCTPRRPSKRPGNALWTPH